ncbi:hypothetical protein AB0G04_16675 [Actinoplanes sp. NPDC023801]|uniref:hypothetical protein n=1 Tax=Actinoplanes sp. NPDC023801 TaxID=3154595 RepID=UPI0033FDB1AC
MKIRRADKHYEARHGGTADRFAGLAPVAAVTAGITVSLVTGALFRDDVAAAAHRILGDHRTGLVLAGWCFVALVAGTAALCLRAANSRRVRSRAARITLVVVAALAAPVVLWFLPARQDKDPFPAATDDFVTGGQTAWITVLAAGAAIVFGSRRLLVPAVLLVAVISIASLAATIIFGGEP